MIGLSLAMTAIAFEPRKVRISSASRFRIRLTASVLGLISSLPAGAVAADVESQEVEALVEVDDVRLVLVEDQAPGLSHSASRALTCSACLL